MKLLIEQELAQATVNYLIQRPYGEVAALIAEFAKLPVAMLPEAEEEAVESTNGYVPAGQE